jgi:hypothetical protein
VGELEYSTNMTSAAQRQLSRVSRGTGKTMYSKKQFTALETMCREQAALARSEMEYSLMKYWLVEAEEWKQLTRRSANNGKPLTRTARDGGRFLEHRSSARCEQLGGFYRAQEDFN